MADQLLESFTERFSIKADYACFLKPYNANDLLLKETYLVIPPSSVRSVIDRVYWKPEFKIDINSIKVCKPIITKSFSNKDLKFGPINSNVAYFDRLHKRTSNIEVLLDVLYVVDVTYKAISESNKSVEEHLGEIKRRCNSKEYFKPVTLGNKKFVADVSLSTGFDIPISDNLELEDISIDYIYEGTNRTPITADLKMINGLINL